MINGFLYMIIATACWGFAFGLPPLVSEFGVYDIVGGRFLIYGLLSILLFAKAKKRSFPLHYWTTATSLALASNTLYYIFIVWGIDLLGPAFATLIAGMLPIVISLYGNWIKHEFPFKIFILPLLLIFCGLISVNLKDFMAEGHDLTLETLFGVLCCLSAVSLWAWYGVKNAQFLEEHPEMPPSTWACMIGIISMMSSGCLIAVGSYLQPEQLLCFSTSFSSEAWMRFALVSAALGLGAGWLATFLWGKAGKILPISLMGQFLITEILFGLFYIYLGEWRLPTPSESIGISLATLGVLLGIQKASRAKQQLNLTKLHRKSY